jgi:hypothetical protein
MRRSSSQRMTALGAPPVVGPAQVVAALGAPFAPVRASFPGMQNAKSALDASLARFEFYRDRYRTALKVCLAQARLRGQAEIALVQGDVVTPPFADGSVDVVISSLFLHHFTPTALMQLLPKWVRLARRGLVMSDLVRHPVPYWFMKASSPVFARSAITRHDAAVSVQRAYRPQELQNIAVEAGFPQAQVFTHFPYRMTLVIDRTES